jgi:hypothetical protein
MVVWNNAIWPTGIPAGLAPTTPAPTNTPPSGGTVNTNNAVLPTGTPSQTRTNVVSQTATDVAGQTSGTSTNQVPAQVATDQYLYATTTNVFVGDKVTVKWKVPGPDLVDWISLIHYGPRGPVVLETRLTALRGGDTDYIATREMLGTNEFRYYRGGALVVTSNRVIVREREREFLVRLVPNEKKDWLTFVWQGMPGKKYRLLASGVADRPVSEWDLVIRVEAAGGGEMRVTLPRTGGEVRFFRIKEE